MTLSPNNALRIAIGSAILAGCLAANLLSRAQGGPGWEVPLDVVISLAVGPFFVVALIVVALVALLKAGPLSYIPRTAIIGTVAVLLAAVLLTTIIIFSEPAQWPVRYPNASAVASVLPLPTFIVSGVMFWLVGFYCVDATYRRALQAVLAIMTFIIWALLSTAGMYFLIFLTYPLLG